jgi:hypothetical protein
VKKGRSKDTADDLEALDGDEDGLAGEVDDEEQSEDPSLDAMIKVKKESKKTASSSGAAAAGAAGRKKTGAPAATRGRGGGRGGRKKAAE